MINVLQILPRRRVPRRLCGSCYGALALLTALGCGPSGMPGLIPVEGTVTYQGKPLPEGEVRYVPQTSAGGRMARGRIRSGSFSLTTASRDDGVKPGEYRIVVIAYGKEQEPERDAQGFVTKEFPRPLLVPEPYTNPDTTPLTDVVDENHRGHVKLELKD